MKRSVILVLTVLLVMAVAVPAMAAPWGGRGMGPGQEPMAYAELTEEQRAQIAERNKVILEERKQMLDRRVEWGYLSRAEADSMLVLMKERMNKYPYAPMYGRNGYGGGGRGGYGNGYGGGGNCGCW